MGSFLPSLARVVAAKIVSGLLTIGAALGVIVPLDESTTVTAALTVALAAVLQVLGQIVLAWAEKEFPWLAAMPPLVLRVRLRKPLMAARR